MLAISRKQGERIRIGKDIIVAVGRVSGNRVSLAIEAPADVKILRDELCRQGDDGKGEIQCDGK